MKKLLSLILSLIMLICIGCAGGTAYAAYLNESEYRPMTELINDFRKGKSAWYWNETQTEKIYCKNLAALSYDENLEKIAKIRAKEISEKFSHERPDGTLCFSCTAKDANGNTVKTWGENIAGGTNLTMEDAFELWKENDADYTGQGHRRLMLNGELTCIGIAAYEAPNGWTYWVQEFGYELTAQANASDSTVYIAPKKPKIQKLTAKKKGFKVSWSAVTKHCTGYQLQYSTDKKFKKNKKAVTVNNNSKIAKTVKKLKSKKKYYVRVRAYRVVNGTKIYSKWTKKKVVKTK